MTHTYQELTKILKNIVELTHDLFSDEEIIEINEYINEHNELEIALNLIIATICIKDEARISNDVFKLIEKAGTVTMLDKKILNGLKARII